MRQEQNGTNPRKEGHVTKGIEKVNAEVDISVFSMAHPRESLQGDDIFLVRSGRKRKKQKTKQNKKKTPEIFNFPPYGTPIMYGPQAENEFFKRARRGL